MIIVSSSPDELAAILLQLPSSGETASGKVPEAKESVVATSNSTKSCKKKKERKENSCENEAAEHC